MRANRDQASPVDLEPPVPRNAGICLLSLSFEPKAHSATGTPRAFLAVGASAGRPPPMRGLYWICLTSGQEAPSCIAIMTSFPKPASSAHSSIVKQPFSGHTSYTDNNDELRHERQGEMECSGSKYLTASGTSRCQKVRSIAFVRVVSFSKPHAELRQKRTIAFCRQMVERLEFRSNLRCFP